MAMKVARPCSKLSQPAVHHSPAMHQTLTVGFTPAALRRIENEGVLVSLHRPPLLGMTPCKLFRARSCEFPKPRFPTLRRSCSASLDSIFSDEDSSKKMQELALRFQASDDDSSDFLSTEPEFLVDSSEEEDVEGEISANIVSGFQKEPPPPDWAAGDEIGGVEIPPSLLRMIKRKNKWQEEGFMDTGDSAYYSMKAAFSSLVLMIRELHVFTLQTRELIYYEDLQEVCVRTQKEIQASFIWLFQHVFSHTPTLMVYVMMFLANFAVHSTSSNAATLETEQRRSSASYTTKSIMLIEKKDERIQKYDSSAITSLSVASSGGNTASVVGISGRPGVDGWFEQIVPDGASQVPGLGAVRGEDSEEEARLWNSMVEEAAKMQAELRDEALDTETVSRFVSPVTANVEEIDDYADYFRTEMVYQVGLAKDPNNTLLLANYAQFLSLVLHDYVRAEDYFKRAVEGEPKDAEACSKYANFLWQVKKDLWAAEETFLDAISAEPENSFYAANYAHFLWNTGCDGMCFPLDRTGGPLQC
ncbi:hypothetical protein Dimus_009225 [Dionaea muscipula]